jgi:hypothetical protein
MDGAMGFDYRAFIFIISLAAVINALGLVRLLNAFAEYLRNQQRIEVAGYWVFALWALFQFLLHILIWWSLWEVREVDTFNLLLYLYLLSGPVILYLGTSLLVPDVDEDRLDLRAHYFRVRRPFFTVMGLFWVWAIFSWPVIKGMVAPTLPILGSYLGIAVILRFTENVKVHAGLVIAVWTILIIFIAAFGMRLGGLG